MTPYQHHLVWEGSMVRLIVPFVVVILLAVMFYITMVLVPQLAVPLIIVWWLGAAFTPLIGHFFGW